MTTQIAFLRGINVGAHKRIAMADLRRVLSDELGYDDARTLLQSGNIVLSAKAKPAELADDLERVIEQKLDVPTPVLVRTHEELAAVVDFDPLGDVADNPKLYQVSFLSAEPDAEKIEKIAADELLPERFVHRGREIYAWHPDGMHSSPLARLLTDRRLGVTATARNWNTVTKLLEMAEELE
jgi:uncharacterized protein (DUF1697 family)